MLSMSATQTRAPPVVECAECGRGLRPGHSVAGWCRVFIHATELGSLASKTPKTRGFVNEILCPNCAKKLEEGIGK
jgi:hypothetical protein